MQKEATIELKELLEEHALRIVPYNDWLTLDGNYPGFRASTQNVRQSGQGFSLRLDIEVILNTNVFIIESFAGLGRSTEEALKSAFANFALNSLHVFLNAVCGKSDDQVTIEEWTIGNRKWKVVIGNFGIRASETEDVPLPESLFQTIEDLIRQKELEPRIHWVRTFYGNVGNGNADCEFLFDNGTWEYAESALRNLDWAKKDHYYSVRNFLIMLPNS